MPMMDYVSGRSPDIDGRLPHSTPLCADHKELSVAIGRYASDDRGWYADDWSPPLCFMWFRQPDGQVLVYGNWKAVPCQR